MGIGLLRQRPWARRGTILWLVFTILFGAASTAYTTLIVMKAYDVISDLIVIGIFLIALAWLVIYCLTRPDVIAAYDGNE